MGRRRKNKTELSADIVLYHILPRLPAKCLRRFRFVSKQWHSFILTPVFAKMHLHHQIQNQNHHKLLLLSDETFRTIDCANPRKDIDCVINNPFPSKVVGARWYSAVASLHGMVCLCTIKNCREQYESYNLVLWNPFTGEYKRLSEAGFPKDGHHTGGHAPIFGLYYSSSDNDYKLLLVTCYIVTNVYMYSLKSDSWRKVDCLLTEVEHFRLTSFHSNTLKRDTLTAALLNEKLYFLVARGSYRRPSYLIIRFDTKTEKLTEIAIPAFSVNIRVNWLNILVARGCIHLCVKIDYDHVELWRMDGDGDGEYWTEVVSSFPKSLEPLQLMTNENGFMLFKDDYNLCVVDMMNNATMRFCSVESLTGIVEYIETIVSPNQYTK